MKKIAFGTLGCKVNQYETAALQEQFSQAGYQIVPWGEPADIAIINTCTVTGKSDISSRQLIRKIIKKSSPDEVLVTGCYAETNPADIMRIEGVSKVISNQEKQDIFTLISGKKGSEFIGSGQRTDSEKKSRAFVAIQDGCNAACSYCIVPQARGKATSRNPQEILEQLKQVIQQNFKEIVLSGIHIGAYGTDHPDYGTLTALLQQILLLPGLGRIRLSSIEPHEINKTLIALFNHPKLCNHLHIPLQSGSNKVLQQMNRSYTREQYQALVETLANQFPHMGLGADVMVGFPGETDHDFHETVSLVEQLPFSSLHVFSYSPRKNTPAATMHNQIPDSLKKERSTLLRKLAEKKAATYQKEMVGNILSATFIRNTKQNSCIALTDNYLKVALPGNHIEKQNPWLRSIQITAYKKQQLHGIFTGGNQ